MRFSKHIKTGKYLNKMYLFVTAALVILVLLFAGTIYLNLEKSALKKEYDTNQKTLTQIKYFIDYMDDMARNLCSTIYLSKEATNLMYCKNIDWYDVGESMKTLQSMNSIIPNNAANFSIYNKYNNVYFSTYNGAYKDNYILEDIIHQQGTLPKSRMIPRKVLVTDPRFTRNERYVFSYIMYDSLNEQGYMDGGLIFDIKPEWLLDNIKMINGIDVKKKNEIFILGLNGEFIENSDREDEFRTNLRKVYMDHIGNMGSTDGKVDFFIDNILGEKYFITYIKAEKVNLVVLRAQLLNQVFTYLNQLKTSIIVICAAFLLIALIVAVVVSKRIYKPIAGLVKHIHSYNSREPCGEGVYDEISYIYEMYKNTTFHLENYKKESYSNRDMIKTYFLRKLLVDSASIAKEEFDKIRDVNNVSLVYGQNFALSILRIDNYKEFERDNNLKDKELLKFAIMNITAEVFSQYFVNETVDMGNDLMVVIMNVDRQMMKDFQNKAAKLAKQSQEYILKNFNLSLSVTISELIDNVSELSKCYNSVLISSMYRFVFGRACIITPEKMKNNLENKIFDYPVDLERKLVDEIKAGNLENAQKIILKIVNLIRQYNYNNIILSLTQMANTIINTFERINEVKLKNEYVNYSSIYQKVFEVETIDDLCSEFVKLLNEFQETEISNRAQKHEILVETIKNIIHKNYEDSGMCLQKIASMLNMSPTYIGRIFKEQTNLSIAGYLNDIRLEKAIELLKNSNLSVSKVTNLVGIDSETYFYRIFKKKFGITPKEYMTNLYELNCDLEDLKFAVEMPDGTRNSP